MSHKSAIKIAWLSSYPKPGSLVIVQSQPRVLNLGEFGDGGRAVSQHEPEAHGTQNRGKCRKVQLSILHFAVERKRNTDECRR